MNRFPKKKYSYLDDCGENVYVKILSTVQIGMKH